MKQELATKEVMVLRLHVVAHRHSKSVLKILCPSWDTFVGHDFRI
jgi:hypothetical protein